MILKKLKLHQPVWERLFCGMRDLGKSNCFFFASSYVKHTIFPQGRDVSSWVPWSRRELRVGRKVPNPLRSARWGQGGGGSQAAACASQSPAVGNGSILSHLALSLQDRPARCPDVLIPSEGNRAQICFFPVSSCLAESRLEKRICRVILASKVVHPP